MQKMNNPLYHTLHSKSELSEISTHKKKKIINMIQHMNDDEHEILYMLIRNYQIDHYENILTIPYEGKYDNDNLLVFDLEKLPNRLKHMIYHFCIMNKKSKSK